MIQVRQVPAPVEPVVLVKVVQLLRRVVHLELVVLELVVLQQVEPLASAEEQESEEPAAQQSRLVQAVPAAASEIDQLQIKRTAREISCGFSFKCYKY